MVPFTSPALNVLQRQLGHITARQLAESGVGRTARQRLVNHGVLLRPYKSVYRIAGVKPSLEQRLIALSLAHPAGFITGPTLGSYLGLRRMPRSSSIVLCLPHGKPADVDHGVRVRQSTKIVAADRRALDNGMIIASWPRLLFDLAADLSPQSLASVIEQALQRNDCTIDELGRIAVRLCHPMRPGSELFARMLVTRGDRAPVESHPELVVLEGLRARGVPVVPQLAELSLPNGRRVRLDLAVPKVRWAVEIDVHPAHLSLLGTTTDKQRDRQLHLIDWQVERVTEIDLLDLPSLLDELRSLYLARVRSLAA